MPSKMKDLRIERQHALARTGTEDNSGCVWSHGSGLWLRAWSHEGDRFSMEVCKSSVYVRCAYGVHWHFYPPVNL